MGAKIDFKDSLFSLLALNAQYRPAKPSRMKSGGGKKGKRISRIVYICAKKFLLTIMAEIEKKTEVDVNGVPAVEAEQVKEVPSRPNRDKYASMFGEDNPDVDFEDKEARYGRMAEERENYRNLKKAGSGLSQALDKNRWLAAMFQDLANNPDKDPISWMYDNGIDVQKAMEDEEYRTKVAEGLAQFQQRQVDNEALAQEKADNLEKSANELDALSKELGLSDEQCDRLWSHMFENVIVPGMDGTVTKDTWTMALHAMNYDTDVANAREEGAIQARNEKHQNKVKNFEERQVPPSFSQGQGQRVTPRAEKKESLMDFVRKNS